MRVKTIVKKLICSIVACCSICMCNIISYAADELTIRIVGTQEQVDVIGVFYNEADGGVLEIKQTVENKETTFKLPAEDYERFQYRVTLNEIEVTDSFAVKEIKASDNYVKVVDLTWITMLSGVVDNTTEETLYNTVGTEGVAYGSDSTGNKIESTIEGTEETEDSDTIKPQQKPINTDKTKPTQIKVEQSTDINNSLLRGAYTVILQNDMYSEEIVVPYNQKEQTTELNIPDGEYTVKINSSTIIQEIPDTCIVQNKKGQITVKLSPCLLYITENPDVVAYKIKSGKVEDIGEPGAVYGVNNTETYVLQLCDETGKAYGKKYRIKIPEYAKEVYFDFATGSCTTSKPTVITDAGLDITPENPYGIPPTSAKAVKNENTLYNVSLLITIGSIVSAIVIHNKNKQKIEMLK